MGLKQLHFPNTQENDIKSRTFEIEKSIKDLKEQLNSNDFWVVNAYKSLNAEFRSMQEHITIFLFRVYFRPIDTKFFNMILVIYKNSHLA